jgi:hypothetical protein
MLTCILAVIGRLLHVSTHLRTAPLHDVSGHHIPEVSDVGKGSDTTFFITTRAIALDAGEEVFGVIAPLDGFIQADVVSLLILTTPIAVLGLGDRPYIIISIQPAIITSPPWVGLIELMSSTLPVY